MSSGGGTKCVDCDNAKCGAGYQRTGTCGTKTHENTYKCSLCNACKEGEYTAAACTSSTDAVCKTCKVCPAGAYRTSKCTTDRDTQCETCSNSNCQEGVQVRVGTCADTTNGYTCETCGSLTCSTGTYRTGQCGGTSLQYTCKKCSKCSVGTEENGGCDGRIDTASPLVVRLNFPISVQGCALILC